jgi:hypothetical protein
MKFIEELSNGDTFKLLNEHFVLTTDFKKNGQRLCVNLSNGQSKWIESSSCVDISPIYSLDQNSNLVQMKEYKDQNDITKNSDIS